MGCKLSQKTSKLLIPVTICIHRLLQNGDLSSSFETICQICQYSVQGNIILQVKQLCCLAAASACVPDSSWLI